MFHYNLLECIECIDTIFLRNGCMYKDVIVVNSETLGRGDDTVGSSLLGVLLRKVLASPNKPDAIVFYNSGVK